MDKNDFEEFCNKNEDQRKAHKLGFTSGFDHGVNSILTDLLQDSDKLHVIRALCAKSNNIATQYGKEKGNILPYSNERIIAYADGIRHCLHILRSHGNPLESHNQPEHEAFKDRVKIELTEEDLKYYH